MEFRTTCQKCGGFTLESLAGLTDEDHVTRLGDGTWHLVGDLRAHLAQSNLRLAQANKDDDMKDDYVPPDPYATGLTTLRLATSTPESRFEDEFKADRLAEVERFVALDPLPRLREDELRKYVPPDPYAEGIRALQRTQR